MIAVARLLVGELHKARCLWNGGTAVTSALQLFSITCRRAFLRLPQLQRIGLQRAGIGRKGFAVYIES